MNAPFGIPAPYLTPWLMRLGRRRLPEALWQGTGGRRVVALTFDDGPSRFTPELLAALRRHDVRATFFVLGDRVERRPDVLRQAQGGGHLIALHGQQHRNLARMPVAAAIESMERCREAVEAALGGTGVPQRWHCRPPYGACGRPLLDALQARGLRVVMPAVMPGDRLLPRGWREQSGRVTRRVLRALAPGLIVALHDGEDVGARDGVYDMRRAAAVADALIPALRARGYAFVTVEELEQSPVL